jgi:hypothetical protein
MNTEAAAARDAKREIAHELTNRNIPTPRGGDLWNAMTIMRATRRLGFAAK